MVRSARDALFAFAGVGVAGLLTVILPPYSDPPSSGFAILVCGLVAAGLAVLVGLAAFWAGTRRLVWWVAPLLTFPIIAVARDATGGGSSGLASLVLLPVLSIVLFGGPSQLWAAAAATAAVFMVPLMLIGPPKYDPSDWRRGILLTSIVVVICPILQRAVLDLRTSLRQQKKLSGQLSSVLRAATEHAIVGTDADGMITLFSQGAERMLGLAENEVVGRKRLTALHDPAELAQRIVAGGADDEFRFLVHNVPAGGSATDVWTYRHSDGHPLRVRLTITRLLDDEGCQMGWMAIAQDVTAHEQDHRDLAMAERRWRTLLDHLPDTSVLVVGPGLEYRIAVGAGLAKQGLAGIEGRTLFDTSNADNIALLNPLYIAALNGRSGATEMRSGATGHVHEVVVVPLPPVEGEPEALVVARDVTPARTREMDLETARDHFRRLFDETAHGILLLDPSGKLIRVNPALCSMVMMTREELIGRDVQTLPLDRGPEPSRLPLLLSGQLDRVALERTLIRGDMVADLEVAITAVALPGPDGSVESVLITVVDVSERARHERRLAYLADHDSLTGLANRRKFDCELGVHLDRARRYGGPGSLLMLDLDNFKRINDTFGHPSGDQLLLSVADALRHRMRSTDVVARLGGDEFAVLLPQADAKDAQTVAADLVRLIRDCKGRTTSGDALTITTSIGVLLLEHPETTASEVLRHADLAMYDAKDAGGDRFVLHHHLPTDDRVAAPDAKRGAVTEVVIPRA